MKHVTFHLPSFLRRVRIHGGEFDSSARAMNRVKQVRLLQADLRIVRGSTIERKHMSTKTTFKRIALVAVAALGFGVLSVVPSQSAVTGLIVTATNGTGATVLKSGESTTAATLDIKFMSLNASDSVTVTIVPAAALPATAEIDDAGLWFTESTTSTSAAPTVDTATISAATAGPIVVREAITPGSYFRVIAPAGGTNGTFSVKMKYSLGETNTANTIVAGTYSFNAVVNSVQSTGSITQVVPFNIVVAAAPVAAAAVPAAGSATAYLHAGTGSYPAAGQLADSATAGSFVLGTKIGTIQVKNMNAALALAKDTMTVTMTGSGFLNVTTPSVLTARSFEIANAESFTADIMPDGTSGTGTITIKTAAGASFVKTVTFFDTKPAKVTAAVEKAFIKAGTTQVDGVFAVTVVDGSDNPITNATITAAPTDTATTVGGAADCTGGYDATDKVYYCGVKGLSSTKFGPVAYTITAAGGTPSVKVTTSATVTFADSVATKAVLSGPATGAPGAEVEYTLTLTEKNGYPVADQKYGESTSLLFAKSVTTGFDSSMLPFGAAATDSFTSVSGVITSKAKLPIAGTATLTLTLVGDGLQTLSTDAIDKTIGKTVLTISTDVANPGVDAATDAAVDALDAANAATDAALAAAEAADAATSAAQEASDAVAALSETVTKLIAGLQSQIKSLAAVVARIAKQTKK
jgi:trimeric autotransporter adhesin